jgi:rare lipoprotein A
MFQMRANIVAMGVIGAALLLPDLAQAEQGHASWYALHSRTASGEMMNPSEMTAAHRSLPFGTKVLVENLSNGRSVVVRINDRGPFIAGRIIDVSKAAASTLGMLGSGTAKVAISASGGGSPKVASSSDSSIKVASKSGGKSAKIASSSGSSVKVASKSGGKSAKVASASAGRSSVKSEKRSVAGLMKSAPAVKRIASRANSRKTIAVASRAGARKAVTVASREFAKGRRSPAKGVALASSANPYGAFVRSASFVN